MKKTNRYKCVCSHMELTFMWGRQALNKTSPTRSMSVGEKCCKGQRTGKGAGRAEAGAVGILH